MTTKLEVSKRGEVPAFLAAAVIVALLTMWCMTLAGW